MAMLSSLGSKDLADSITPYVQDGIESYGLTPEAGATPLPECVACDAQAIADQLAELAKHIVPALG